MNVRDTYALRIPSVLQFVVILTCHLKWFYDKDK